MVDVLLHPRMRGELEEASVLNRRILEVLPPGHSPATRSWVQYRYTGLLRDLIKHTGDYKKWNVVTGLVIIAGGFATSGIAVAAGNDAPRAVPWVVFGFGLLVAVAGAVAQMLKLNARTAQYSDLTRRLRDEGWAFANGWGDYAGGPASGENFKKFYNRVLKIEAAAERLGVPEALAQNAIDAQEPYEPDDPASTDNASAARIRRRWRAPSSQGDRAKSARIG